MKITAKVSFVKTNRDCMDTVVRTIKNTEIADEHAVHFIVAVDLNRSVEIKEDYAVGSAIMYANDRKNKQKSYFLAGKGFI